MSQRAAPVPAPDQFLDQPSGAEQEFACFYREHFGRLTIYLMCLGASAHLAAELAQDTMFLVHKRWAAIRFPRAYAWTVAGREFIRHAVDDDAEVPVAEVPEPSAVLARPGDAEAWLQQRQIVEVLRALPPRQRQVMALSLDGWSPSEIAGLLDMDPPAVRASLKKARLAADAYRRTLGEP
jgi:RNA polymerase sigma-70 factor (ECF subfamily)